MKLRQHHILKSAVFFVIVLLLLGLSQTVYSQTTITLTPADNANSPVTIPANATNVIVEVWGAGGSGGSGDANKGNNIAGGGGGGGEYSRSINISPGTYSFQVGAGAPAGPVAGNGSQGGSSSFNGGTVLANGGGGGIFNGAGGAGGTGGTGNDANIAGTAGSAVSGTTGGNGGAGANGGAGGIGSSQGSGTAGTIPGGGGGGASGKNQLGGAGADGQIKITYTPGAACSLTTSGLSNILCNDNGTPSNPADDTFTFDLNPTGTNLGATYNLSGGATGSGTYGSATNFGPYPISGGNLSITITDVSGNCSIGETVTAPATCSTDCNLTSSGLTNILCNDNGTPGNSADDTFSFDLNPTGTNLGTTYSVSGDVNQSGISYGAATNFSGYLITNGNLTITITDDLDGTCQLVDVLVTAPPHCSGAVCNLTASGLTNILCNDNGTPTIPGDDTFTFDLNPTGTNLGTSYTVSGGASGSGTYGSAKTFGPYPISGGNLSITITDGTDGSCTIADTVTAPAPCSTPVCNLTSSGLTNKTCNDNGTSSDPNDDVFYFDLNPTGTLLGATYSVSGAITQSGISYGSATNFGPYPISGGNLSITITDVSTDCSFGPFTVTPPAPCSNGCNLTSAGLSNLLCNNQGTLSDDTDDTFTFTLKPVGTNIGTAYHVSGGITRNNILYSVNEPFGPYLISAGPITITITDATDGSCTINLNITPPTSCSLNHTFTTCASCHITHNAPGTNLTERFGNALLCQNCHADGFLATNKPLPDGDKAVPGVSGNSHAWDVPADNSKGYQTTVPESTTEMGKRLPGGTIICSTCHNQHNNGNAGSPYLRVDNTGDAMCKQCHITRDVQRFQDPAPNKGSHPVGVVYNSASSKLNPTPNDPALLTPGGKIECSSCHAAHDVTGALALTNDGNLLRVTNDINLCRDCHTYPQDHNGFDCKDCHEVHNTVDGTVGNNIFMIRDVVQSNLVVFLSETGTNSFNDGVGDRDGICEVCHAGLRHDNADGTGTNPIPWEHNDGSDKRGQKCTSCHLHNDSFTQPVGPQSCTSCHASAQSGGRGGVVQIVGSGGEFDILSKTSTHVGGATPVEPDAITCEACHYESAGNHPTSQMLLENPESLNTVFSGSDKDIYCIGCHDGTPPTGLWTDISDTAYPGGNPYDKSSYIGIPHDTGNDTCLLCHERHGSQYPTLTKAATNYEVCNACHDGGVASTNISSADIAIPGTSGTGHAFSTGVNPVSANSGKYQTNTPSSPAISARLASGNIVCSTCHNPHNNTNGKLLVSTNTGDAMCKDCHLARDVQRFQDPAPNKGSHPVGVTYSGTGSVKATPTGSVVTIGGNVECSSCHQPHNAATNDGNLLRQANNSTLCTDCHNYGTHNGMTCLDCHEVHNTVDGIIDNNIFMVKGIITTPISGNKTVTFTAETGANSFADGNGNGICEACHDPAASNPTDHFRNDGSGSLHIGDSGSPDPKIGVNCTECHSHNSNFAPSDCVSCHQTNFPTWQVSDGHVAHTTKYNFACSTCHFERGSGTAFHNNGTADINFDPNGLARRNGQDTNTPAWASGTKTCSTVYCHSDGQTARRSTNGTYTWSGFTPITLSPAYLTTPNWDTGSITDCNLCHPGPTSGGITGPVTGNMNPDYLIGPPPGNITARPNTGTHNSGNHSDNDQGLASTNWNGTQCFWCHKADSSIENVPGTVDATTKQYQGTYGIGFDGAGIIPHVDGETQFDPRHYSNGGTFPDNNTYSADATASHCGNPKSCW